jgi:putative thiamine transport system substrate-binding protein
MQPTGDFDVEVLQDKVKSPSSKRPLFLAALLGFAIAASLALIIGLSVGLTQGTLTPLSEAGLLDGDTTDDTQVAFSLSLVSRNWTEVLRRARGTSVRWWFWGLDAQINAFVDTTYGVALKQEFGITLVAVHLNNTFEAVDRVQVEYATGKTSDGSVDLIWLNGESFATMKKGGLLFGPFAEKLPLSRAVDLSNSALAFDFGLAVDNMESVWSQAQYQFVYLPSRTPTSLLPRSFADWINYAKANSGRLSYIFPNKGDFLAARFLKVVFPPLFFLSQLKMV